MPDGISGQGSAPPAQIAQFRSDGFSAATGLRVPFFSDAFSRAFGFPDVRPINMISEGTPIREERPYAAYVGLREVRYSRPGLVSGHNYGTGPIRALFEDLGGGGLGSLFVVSGTGVYRNGISVGTLPGTDLVRFAASSQQVVAVASGAAYVWDGVTYPTFTLITGLPMVSDVTFLADRFVYVATGSNVWWYSEINNGASVLGLDFAQNADSPGQTLAVAVQSEQLVFFGEDTVQFWSPTSDATNPFAPNQGRGYARGVASRDTVRFADNALIWLGNNGVVYRAANEPARISSSSIEDKVRQCANISSCTALVVLFEGHEFYVLNVPGIGSYAYDFSRVGSVEGAYGHSYERGEWAEWQSWNWPQFRCKVSAIFHQTVPGAQNTTVYVGDDTTADVWAMQVGTWTDAGGTLLRKASAFIKVEEGRPRMDSLVLHCVTGVGNPSPPGDNPQAEMRYSDDMGGTWSAWLPAPMGAAGAYRTRVYWQRLGLMRAPGRLIEVRCTDPVDVAFSHLELNPLRAGGS